MLIGILGSFAKDVLRSHIFLSINCQLLCFAQTRNPTMMMMTQASVPAYLLQEKAP